MSIFGPLCSTQFVSYSFFFFRFDFYLSYVSRMSWAFTLRTEYSKSDWEPGGHDWSLSDMHPLYNDLMDLSA